ncbi:MAG: NADH-dependent flavin oxidoreductase, Oye family [Firmicutes bacterium]|nr:NADH-dependent flavin oxidoreductase, Oye family [Bacillota bacterium]
MKNLFDATVINNMKLKNRFVRSATWENMADEKGHITERLFNVYRALAEGEVGLIITSYAFVSREEQPNPGMIGACDDSFIEDYRRLTAMVHSYGSSIVLQLAYGGSATTFKPEQRVIWGPSAVPEIGTGVVPKEMSKDDIRKLVTEFADAAYRAKQGGFDGVEIHAAHGYLMSQWLSPLHNKRQDEYGGPIENRARIIMEVYEAIRKRVGRDYAVLIKINSEDFVPGGMEFSDCLYVCTELAKRGIDAIEVSGGIRAAKELCNFRPNIDSAEKEAYFKRYAVQVAEKTNVPVILIGGVRTFEVVSAILAETPIEYVAMSRPLLANPYLIKQWKNGDTSPSKCIYCNQCRSPQGNVCVLNRR